MATDVSRPTLGVKHNYLITLIVLGCNSLIIFVLISQHRRGERPMEKRSI